MAYKIIILATIVIVIIGYLSVQKHVIYSEIYIEAPSSLVWDVITNVQDYNKWNTQLNYIEGSVEYGETIHLKLSTSGTEPYAFKPKINQWVKEEQFGWVARTGIRGILDGEHTFIIKQTQSDSVTHVINQEVYSGVLTNFIKYTSMMKNADEGFEIMNQELKNYIENEVN